MAHDTGPSEAQAHIGIAPGKLLLLGEHVVVYGAKAVGFPLSLGVKATLRPGAGRVAATLAEGLTLPSEARAAAPEDLVLRALGDLLGQVDVDLHLEVPPMCGYGSSAAVAVALLRARASFLGLPPPEPEALWQEALEVERAAHATPSGVDPAIAVWGEPIVFERTEAGLPRVGKQAFARSIHVVAGWCGTHGGTRASVTGLATLRERRPKLVGAAMATLAEAAETGSRALETGEHEALGPALDLAHGVLSGLGLVADAVESAVRRARRLGALGAKMSGAGGAGGAWIALFSEAASADAAAATLRQEGLPILRERLG